MIKVGEMRKVGFSIEGLEVKTLLKKICFIYTYTVYLESLRHVDYKNRKSFLF